jgi:NitT/TauT family transport system permease protein
MAIIAMVLLIVMMDLVIWRPILAWVQKFRLESVPGASPEEPIMQIWIREAKSLRLLKLLYRQWLFKRRTKRASDLLQEQGLSDSKVEGLGRTFFPDACSAVVAFSKKVYSPKWIKALGLGAEALALACLGFGAYKLLMILCDLSLLKWFILMKNTAWTFLRVVVALLISTLWAVPVGIWLGTNAKRVRVAQPIIQIMASFPAPMLYPIALACLFGLKMSFDWAAMCLMLLGVQWYVLFNVLAGALRIPNQLIDAASLMNLSRWEQWKTLYLPSVFPSLVTGWITAAGGAWNASVVAEYIFYQGAILKTKGLGATLSVATSSGDFTLFAASLTVMVLVVVTLNRVFWSRLYYLAQTRFRMDL